MCETLCCTHDAFSYMCLLLFVCIPSKRCGQLTECMPLLGRIAVLCT